MYWDSYFRSSKQLFLDCFNLTPLFVAYFISSVDFVGTHCTVAGLRLACVETEVDGTLGNLAVPSGHPTAALNRTRRPGGPGGIGTGYWGRRCLSLLVIFLIDIMITKILITK